MEIVFNSATKIDKEILKIISLICPFVNIFIHYIVGLYRFFLIATNNK